MGFFKNLKEDLSQAVNELLPEEEFIDNLDEDLLDLGDIEKQDNLSGEDMKAGFQKVNFQEDPFQEDALLKELLKEYEEKESLLEEVLEPELILEEEMAEELPEPELVPEEVLEKLPEPELVPEEVLEKLPEPELIPEEEAEENSALETEDALDMALAQLLMEEETAETEEEPAAEPEEDVLEEGPVQEDTGDDLMMALSAMLKADEVSEEERVQEEPSITDDILTAQLFNNNDIKEEVEEEKMAGLDEILDTAGTELMEEDSVDMDLIAEMLNEEENSLEEPASKAEPEVQTENFAQSVTGTASDDVTVITKGTRIVGSITSDSSLEINGTVTGDIECLGKLSIMGQVSGNSSASEIYVSSSRLEGNLTSKGSVKLSSGTVVIGDIEATSAVIAGAVKGEIDINGPVVVDSTAIVKGNIKAKSVQINNGAVIDGHCALSYAAVDIDSFFSKER